MVPMSEVDFVTFCNFDAVHDMGMEVREYEEALGGFGFLASALGEGYFFWSLV